MKYVALAAIIFGAAVLQGAQAKQAITGTITDNGCADANHSHMRMGSDDRECTLACVDAHGASYVLYDGKTTYTLSDQKTPEKFAGKKVTVTGTLDAKTKAIKVESIAPSS
jgi:Protein of unknown function (DUF5818)